MKNCYLLILAVHVIIFNKLLDAKMDQQELEQNEDFNATSTQSNITKIFIMGLKIKGSKDNSKISVNKSAFTSWSRWSICNSKSCTQIRRRKCKVKKKCKDRIQIEEKRCKFIRRKGRRPSKCHKRKRKPLSTNEKGSLLLGRNRDKQNIHRRTNTKSRKYKFKIIPTQRDISKRRVLPSRTSKWYSKWSRWSPCSRTCTTHRKRWCRKQKFCGRDIIKETAYCYIDGTYCQKWIEKKVNNNKNNSNGEFFVDTVIEEVPRKNQNDIEEPNSIHHAFSHTQCGILYGGRNHSVTKNAWSMTRIIGGRPSPKGKWPWQVAILNKYKETFCGGTLISPRWVLTAAHCIRRRLYVRLGEYNLRIKDDTEIEMRITQTIVHPGYDSETVDNDVALLRLPILAQGRNFGVACLPRPKQPLPVNRLCTIIGWGKKRSTDAFGSEILHEVQVPIVSIDICKRTYFDYYITSNMFCAGYRKGRMDSCAGDSGGPILCKDTSLPNQPWAIYGITSFGDGCGKKGKYGIYTRLPNYVRWINRVLKISDNHDR